MLKTLHHSLIILKRVTIRLRFVILVVITIACGAIILFKTAPFSVSIKIHSTKAIQQVQSPVSKAPLVTQVSYGTVPGNILSLPATQRAADLRQIKDAGFSEVRVGFNWSIIEPVQNKYIWTDADGWLAAIRTAGLKPIIEIDRVPAWNRPAACSSDPNCAPIATDAFANFAAVVAVRYKADNVAAIEVWNEENSINFWKPIPNANQYAHLLASTYAAVKKVDPTMVVLLGGLSGDSVDAWGSSFVDPRTFLAQVYDTGGKDTFDAVAYHPYIKGFGLPSQISPNNGWAKMAMGANNIRSIMLAHGDAAKDVWITEFGVTTGGNGAEDTNPSRTASTDADHVSLQGQAQIAQAVTDDMRQYPWITNFIWYSYKDDSDATTNPNSGYGLWQSNGQPKPALAVLQTAMQQSK